MIRIDNLSKIYRIGDVIVKALDGVSLSIKKQEFTAVMGPSGSGKSTLMNIIGCLDVPTSGTYMLNGNEVSRLSDNELAEIRNRNIGFVFQGFNLLQKLTALENVELPLIYRGMGARERHRRSREALESVGLGDRMHHRSNQLSGGQQQRVAIARALVSTPPIILADEPTGNLDSKSGMEILKLLADLNRAGNTVIIITHDQNIAMHAQRIIKLQDGRVVEDLSDKTEEGLSGSTWEVN